jgi:hypothetical protein
VIVPAAAAVLGLVEEGPGRETGQPQALAGQVGLIGVAGLGGERGQTVVGRCPPVGERVLGQREESLEPQHSMERFGRETGGGLDASAQLAI